MSSKYAYLVLVEGIKGNHNKYYKMTENTSTNQIDVEYGRVDSSKQYTSYPIHEWESKYKEKIRKGYKDITDLIAVEEPIISDNNKDIFISDNIKVKNLISELQSWAKKTIQKNYKVSANSVTQKMIDTAQELIDKLTSAYKHQVNYNELNKLLLEIYTTIPRRMGDVRDFLFQSNNKTEIEKIIDNEQKLLDTLAGQVTTIQVEKTNENNNNKQNLLEQLGLTVEYIEDKKILQSIKTLMGDSSNLMGNIFKVINKQTQKRYDEKFNSMDIKNELLFFHGSRNQNWFSLLQSGLLIRPAGAIITGGMFGSQGIYFADKARKSIGYTSLSGSYWVNGNDNKAYMALFRVNLGNQKHIYKHTSECYNFNENNIKPFHSVYAHGGADLINSEYVVYNINQCDMKYLIELKK